MLVNLFQNVAKPDKGGIANENVMNQYLYGSYIHVHVYIDTTVVLNNCNRRMIIKHNDVPMCSVLNYVLCHAYIEYELKDIYIFKKNGTTHIGVFTDVLEAEYQLKLKN